MGPGTEFLVDLSDVGMEDIARVGGKNASLGELLGSLDATGVRVPSGFAVTIDGYWSVLAHNGLAEVIAAQIDRLHADPGSLRSVGEEIRGRFDRAEIPVLLRDEILRGYHEIAASSNAGAPGPPSVAVRSSATAEDLPSASFAGQHESYLNVEGDDAVLAAYRDCLRSMFTDRAIGYRESNGFDHLKVALSVGVQVMVRSDVGAAGVMFTIDTETGFPDMVVIDAAWGLGEAVVKGEVDPDRYRVFKPFLGRPGTVPVVSASIGRKEQMIVYRETAQPVVAAGAGGVAVAVTTSTVLVETPQIQRRSRVLADGEVVGLAEWAVAIERHYGRPMDIEWARDGLTGEMFIVQARPETVQAQRSSSVMTRYRVTDHGPVLVSGLAVGDGAAGGPVCRLTSPSESDGFPDGGVLVAAITDPDWGPVMRRAAAVVTDRGGRTSHAAIVSRELGLPAVLGAGDAMSTLVDGEFVTVSCADGDIGFVYRGEAEIERHDVDLGSIPPTRTKVMLNLANPAAASRWWQLPADGIGLARMEFIVNEHVGVHPMALAHPDRVADPAVRAQIAEMTRDYDHPAEFFVDRLAHGVAMLAAPFHPHPVILRMSDFKSNEYAGLTGGSGFEPLEANPMLGWRGASRYYHPGYRDGFALECRAVREVRSSLGFDNVVVMIPFCRTPREADLVLAEMAANGLERGVDGLEVFVMAEIPSNIILAEQFAERFDGFSIGSNDLTQLTLGIDRDSELLAAIGDASDPAVLELIGELIERAHGRAEPRKVGFCGQAPSNDPAYARMLVAAGIDSVSVTPDSFVAVKQQIAAAEAALLTRD